MGMQERADAPDLELLVHGVGGTTAAEMLGGGAVVQVAGDDVAGVYRRPWDVPAEAARRPAGAGPPVQEAYSWSRLTSGSASRALWLLLVPFMLVNIAFWMRPRHGPHTPRTVAAIHDWLLRLLGLALTALFAASFAEVGMDLAAWQCGGSPRCPAGRPWLAVFTGLAPGARLAVGAVLPLAVVAGLWLLSRHTWHVYESQHGGANRRDSAARPAAPRGGGHGAESLTGPGSLADPDFWTGRDADRFRGTHIATALAVVALLLLTPALVRDRSTGSALRYADWTGLAAVAALLAACAVHLALPAAPGAHRGPLRRGGLGAPAVLVAALAMAVGALPRGGWHSAAALPGMHTLVTALLCGQLALVLLLVATTAVLRRGAPAAAPGPAGTDAAPDPAPEPGPVPAPRRVGDRARLPAGGPAPGPLEPPGFGGGGRQALHGFAAPATAALAVAVGVLFTTGLDIRMEDLVDRGSTPGALRAGPAGAPAVLEWHAAAMPVWTGLLLVLAGLAALRVRRTAATEAPRVTAVYRAEGDPDGARAGRIAAALARARLTDTAPVALGVAAAAAVLLGAAAVLGAVHYHRPPQQAFRGPATHDTAAVLQQTGSWLVLAVAALAVALGHRAYSSRGTRRTVGILWDVGTFWPRTAHPLAPPCYAERAVLDLVWRTRAWCARTGGRLVLSGHSQGTVLVAAAARQLDGAAPGRVAVLTYGSPLLRLYARFFPAYFAEPDLAALGRARPWRNLYRFTDPIGGPVDVPGVDAAPLPDPVAYGRSALHPLPSPVRAHGDYPADPRFGEERAALLERLDAPRPGAAPPAADGAPGAAPAPPRPGTERGPAGPSESGGGSPEPPG